jgi:branched-chain amino acid transport system permease protein
MIDLGAIKTGAIAGVAAVIIALVGMVETFGQRFVVSGIFTLGQFLALSPMLLAGYTGAVQRHHAGLLVRVSSGLAAGIVAGLIAVAFVSVGTTVNLRVIFTNASPALFGILTFGRDGTQGLIFLEALSIGAALSGALTAVMPQTIRQGVIMGFLWMCLFGILRDLLAIMFSAWGPLSLINELLFAQSGLKAQGAAIVWLAAGILSYLWSRHRRQLSEYLLRLPPQGRATVRFGSLALAAVILLLLPEIVGSYPSEVFNTVGLYVLMGLGLNIVVGFAGMLDLGYVAFFAIGAYSMGILTSPERGLFSLTFWEALPIAVAVSVLAGVILGVPVLKMRGDYLAIVTLGFGEIIRILAISDWLRPFTGGAQGIQRIARATIGSLELSTPQSLYYLILAAVVLAAFVSLRLKDSRLGRAWMAMREDEDVAQATGINLVRTKLLAFGTGAAFSGLSGAIFAAKLTSAYPHSFSVLVSINVLSLIIVGGMGSIPGVIVGAMALVGLPELLREFAEYRLLVYGAALVFMMLKRPEGLWPEVTRKRELHEAEEAAEAVQPAEMPSGG